VKERSWAKMAAAYGVKAYQRKYGYKGGSGVKAAKASKIGFDLKMRKIMNNISESIAAMYVIMKICYAISNNISDNNDQ